MKLEGSGGHTSGFLTRTDDIQKPPFYIFSSIFFLPTKKHRRKNLSLRFSGSCTFSKLTKTYSRLVLLQVTDFSYCRLRLNPPPIDPKFASLRGNFWWGFFQTTWIENLPRIKSWHDTIFHARPVFFGQVSWRLGPFWRGYPTTLSGQGLEAKTLSLAFRWWFPVVERINQKTPPKRTPSILGQPFCSTSATFLFFFWGGGRFSCKIPRY